MKPYLLIALMLVGHACGQTVINGNNRTVVSLSVSPSTASVVVGTTTSLDCIALLSDGTHQTLTDQVMWTSSDSTIATVDDTSTLHRNGNMVTGIAAGSATISCTDAGGKVSSPSSTVTVLPAPSITFPTCAVQPCALPAGTNGSAYSKTFTAIGGVPPYTWSVIAGSFAACGVSLTGAVLSGVATTGSCSATVQVAALTGSPATVQVTLGVTATCNGGPPTFPCSTTSLNNPGQVTAPFSSTAPTPNTCAGKCVNDIEFDSSLNPNPVDPYVRVTDGSSDCGAQTGQSINATGTGGDNDRDWSKNGTYLAVFTTGSFTCILHLNLSGAAPQVINTGHSALKLSTLAGFSWSPSVDTRFYYLNAKHILTQGDIVNDTTFTSTVLADITGTDVCPGRIDQIPAATVTWTSVMTVSSNDDTFIFSVSTTGGQGTGTITLAWSRTKGCWAHQADSGAVFAFCPAGNACRSTSIVGVQTVCFGATGSGTGIHETLGSLDGNYAFVERTGTWPSGSACAGISTGGGPLVLRLDSSLGAQLCNATDPPVGQGCVSHSSVGNTHLVNAYWQGATIRSTNAVTAYSTFTSAPSPGFEDWHGGWPNPLFDDSYPYIVATDQLSNSNGSGCAVGVSAIYCPIALHNMIFAEFPGTLYPPGHIPLYILFGHTFSCGLPGKAVCSGGADAYFQGQNSIMSVSPDGKYAAFASSMFCSLGLDVSNKCRQDVFVIKLQ